MKNSKKILAAVLSLFMALALVPAIPAQAAASIEVNSKVRTYPNEEGSIYVYIEGDSDTTLKSAKSSSKDLIAKVTDKSEYESATSNNRSYSISTFSKKSGKYTVSLSFSDGSKKKVTVYNYPHPVKSVKIDGKNILENTNKSKAKVKVTMNKGAKLKKVEYSYSKKYSYEDGYYYEDYYKTFKNGGTIKINKQQGKSHSSYEDSYDYTDEETGKTTTTSYKSTNDSDYLLAYTYVRVTYTDKYTGEEDYYTTTVATVLKK